MDEDRVILAIEILPWKLGNRWSDVDAAGNKLANLLKDRLDSAFMSYRVHVDVDIIYLPDGTGQAPDLIIGPSNQIERDIKSVVDTVKINTWHELCSSHEPATDPSPSQD